jgi:hypothetical protein
MPPGGGSPALVRYTYTNSQQPAIWVPLNDIFGSTIAGIQVGISGIQAKYTYDPNGNNLTISGARTPWPFLWHGLEQEYDDTWKLYMEPDGNFYNPDPFELSLVGPQGLDAPGPGPGAIGGPGGSVGGPPLFVQNYLNESGSEALVLATALDETGWGIVAGAGLQLFAGLFPDLFGSHHPSIPYQEQHQRHPAYCGTLGICDWIVTQRGYITLAQADEDEDEKEGENDLGLGRIFEGKRPVIPSGGLLVPTEVGNFVIPEGSEIGPARSGRGYRFRTGKANPEEIRIMDPDLEHGYPNGYVRFYFKNQPVNPNTGKPVSDAEGHYKILP